MQHPYKATCLCFDTFILFAILCVEQRRCCLEVREVCHRLYRPHELGCRRGSLQSQPDAPGAAAGVALHRCMTVKKGRAEEQQYVNFLCINKIKYMPVSWLGH